MKPHTRYRGPIAAAALAVALPVTWYLLKDDPNTTGASPEVTSLQNPAPEGDVTATKPVPTAAPEKSVRETIANSSASTIIGSQWQSQATPEFAAFSGWTDRYLAAAKEDRAAMLPEGIAAATERREVLAKMIRENPEQALAAAVPVMVRKDLPAQVTALLEERVSGPGSISTLSGTPIPGSKTVISKTRHALVGSSEYVAFPYGRRAGIPDLPEASILGIALDGSLAVSDSPIRVLESGETADGKKVEEVCLISGDTTPVKTNGSLNTHELTAVETNGKVQMVCKPAHISRLEARLISGEGLQASGADGSSTVTGRPTFANTHGPKKILIIRVDFSDLEGTPVNDLGSGNTDVVTPEYAVDGFNATGGVKDYFEQCSYGKTTLVVSPVVSGISPDVTEVLRMPNTAASYATTGEPGIGQAILLHTHAQAAAGIAGFNPANYDRIVVSYSSFGGIEGNLANFAGLGDTPGKKVWISAYYTLNVISHELGHTYGMNHSSSWVVTDGNPVSPTGTLEEYGDTSDIMGNGKLITNQFNHWNKSIVQWLPDADVTTVNTGGTYRIHRFDHPNANLADKLALKVVRNRTQDYWIGYRRATDNSNYDNGAYIVWGANQNTNGLVLDFNTPGNTVDDAPLAIGQTFNDTAAGITLHTVGQGGSGASEYLDVEVTFQPRLAWTSSTYNADEESGTATLTVSRSNDSTGAVSVHWATAPGTATSPADFTASSGDLTWADGDAADKVITIPLVADGSPEGSENFTVTLSAPTGGSVIVDAPAATVNIVDPGGIDQAFAADFINNDVKKVVVQPDGSILIMGTFDELDGGQFHRGIARMTSAGAVDIAFTGGGAGSGTTVLDLARQPDGKIVVVGDFTTMNGVARNRVARLNADGSLDTNFNPGTGADGTVKAVLVQPDGKVLIGGEFINFNGTAREYLARLNADGSLDTAFTGPDFADPSGWNVSSLALQADGKLLVGGSYYFPDNTNTLCRLTTTGTRDATFNGVVEGATAAGDTSTLNAIDSIAVQLDGKILIAGAFGAYNGTARGGLARLTDTGALDTDFPATSDGACNTVLVQPDGKIVVGGTFTTFNGASRPRLVRLTPAGVVDTGFAAAGAPSQPVFALAMQADGKIVLGTGYGSFQGQVDKALFRTIGGLPGLPGTIQLSGPTVSTTEGGSLSISVTRTGGSSGALSVNYATVIGTADADDFTPASGTLSWADGDSVVKNISIPIATDALVEATETFTVNLGQPLLGGAILGSTQATTVSISDPGAITAYQTWKNAKFTAEELEQVGISGDNADPDQDGIVNLLEFAFNLAPKTSSQTGMPVGAIQNIGGNDYFTLTFRRQLAAPELTYTPRTNGTLPGTWMGDAVLVGTPVGNGDGTETVTYRDSVAVTAATHRFMHVLVTLAQ